MLLDCYALELVAVSTGPSLVLFPESVFQWPCSVVFTMLLSAGGNETEFGFLFRPPAPCQFVSDLIASLSESQKNSMWRCACWSAEDA